MTMDKTTMIRDYLLSMIERGDHGSGDQLPGARELSERVQATLVKVQSAIETLVQDGVLETIPRQGTFVQPNWSDRILQTNLTLSAPQEDLPWVPGLREILTEELPRLRITSKFSKSVFELRSTLAAQRNQNDYLDLSELFRECYPDDSIFFPQPFEGFYSNGKLIGVPFIFSPRVMFYNTRLIERHGGERPVANWTWDDFISSIRHLRRHLSPEEIVFWAPEPWLWMNVVARAGGALFEPAATDPVKIDDPATVRGLKLFSLTREELGVDVNTIFGRYCEDFAAGNRVYQLAPRQVMTFFKQNGFNDWGTVPLPSIPGGDDVSIQATDLLCVRKSCADMNLAKDFIRTMLSERVQDFIAGVNYGIPVRKTSATKSVAFDDPRDTLFLNEIPRMSAEYHIDSPELHELVIEGIRQIWDVGGDLEGTTAELANVARVILRIRNNITGRLA